MNQLTNKDTILINIVIPEKNIERNIEWSLKESVESLKMYILKIVPGLEDSLNYGFFLPPSNGKNGKFLQEERILDHYYTEETFKLELKKKIRSYHMSTNSPKLKKINSKSNQKQLIQFIRSGDVMKINKFLFDGIDPNFHIPGITETPLSLACKLKDPHVIIMALVNNGAFLDFRSQDSLTALHKTAIEGLYEPMKTLLQLGQSPNCKDNRGFTPLYYCIENDAPAECVELLLFEHSMMGVRDEHGLQEIHKACLHGRTKHLDHLISYGASIDARTNKGNTALHICALHNQGTCARLLLYRGVTRHALNEESKSAYQTALLSNNIDLADLIQNFRDEDVVPVTTLPKFNEKRRSIIPAMKRFSNSERLSEAIGNVTPDNQTIYSGDRISLYGSVKSLPQGNSSLLNTPQKQYNFSQRNSDSLDCQSLQNFPSSKSKENFTQLNTWTSSGNPGANANSNVKNRLPIASILNSKLENIPRVVVLQKGPLGFGFVIRGNKNDHDVNFIAKPSSPATHYFDNIANNSPSQSAGLFIGDFLLEVNNIDVHKMPHEEVVRILHLAGDNLTMKVITVNSATASDGLFDGCSDENSCSDSISLMSDNSVSLVASHSNCVYEGTSDNKELLKVSATKHTQVPKQSLSPLLPTESKDEFKLKIKAANQNNKRNASVPDVVKVVKALAPPPPMRADNSSLATSQSSNDIKYSKDTLSKSDYQHSDATITPNDLTTSNRSIGQPVNISNSSRSSSKLYIPPPDYNVDTVINDHVPFTKNSNTQNGVSAVFKPSVITTQFVPPPPPPVAPPPPPPPSSNGSAQSSTSGRLHNLEKAITAISLKPVVHNDKEVQNDECSPSISSHEKALRDAILNHRKKVECGETISTDIDGKLKENRTGNKSIVFQATSSVVPNADSFSPNYSAPAKLKTSDFPPPPSAAGKNPPIKPKPGSQNFFVTSNTKPMTASDSVSPNAAIKTPTLNESNLRFKAEKLRTDLVKKEQESKGTMYFTSTK